MTNNTKKTVKFISRHLSLLPSQQQCNDINKMAIIFYSIVSLSALDVDVIPQYSGYADWIRSHYKTSIVAGEDKFIIGGFTGSLNMAVPNVTTMSLPNTLFALLILLTIDDDTILTDNKITNEIRRFVSRCQIKSHGGFVSTLDYHTSEPSPIDSHDLRFSYIAVAILYILGCRTVEDFDRFIDVNKLLDFISKRQCDIGAFGEDSEPHAGYTSCALSTLHLLKKVGALPKQFKDDTIEWLVMRQVSNLGCMSLQDELNESYDLADIGGFQGRENKFADTCYAFWCLNSLSILTNDNWRQLVKTELVEKYLAETTENKLVGGYQKNNESDPDLYHTCLGIAAMELIHGNFDGPLCIPAKVATKYNL